MTRMSELKLPCPNCGREQTCLCWFSLNVDLDPSLRQRLFEGEINGFTCEACGHKAFINMPLLYHDMTRKFSVQFFPEAYIEDVTNFRTYTSEGKVRLTLFIIKGSDDRYLESPHVVFDMNEMTRYILFREILYARDHAE
jgi:hypothetical protein